MGASSVAFTHLQTSQTKLLRCWRSTWRAFVPSRVCFSQQLNIFQPLAFTYAIVSNACVRTQRTVRSRSEHEFVPDDMYRVRLLRFSSSPRSTASHSSGTPPTCFFSFLGGGSKSNRRVKHACDAHVLRLGVFVVGRGTALSFLLPFDPRLKGSPLQSTVS